MTGSNYIDLAIIIIPFLLVTLLIVRYVVPKNPKLGYSLAGLTGILGAFFLKRRIDKIFAVEEKIAEHSEELRTFKNRQKRRSEAVLANEEAMRLLQKQREKLAKNADQHKTKIETLDKEIEERQQLQEKLMEDPDTILSTSGQKGQERVAQSNTIETDPPQFPLRHETDKEFPSFELLGHRLTEVK